jgi:hypothetical protein
VTEDSNRPEPGEARPARRPSPTANPASRARRIGGRPPRPGPAPAPAPAETDVTADAPARPRPGPRPSPAPGKPATPAPVDEVGWPPAETPRGSGPDRRLARLPAAVLGLAAMLLLALVLVFSHGVYWAKPDHSAGARSAQQERVLAAVKKCYATINTFDYRHLNGLVHRALPCTTGKFTSDVRTALQKTIIPKAPAAKATQTAQINRAGIVSVSPDGRQWVTLLFGQLVISNATTAKNAPRTDVFGAVVTVDQVGGKWLISKVDFDAGSGLGG